MSPQGNHKETTEPVPASPAAPGQEKGKREMKATLMSTVLCTGCGEELHHEPHGPEGHHECPACLAYCDGCVNMECPRCGWGIEGCRKEPTGCTKRNRKR